MRWRGWESFKEKRDGEVENHLKEVVEEKLLDKYLDNESNDENSDEFYEKAEHVLEKKKSIIWT